MELDKLVEAAEEKISLGKALIEDLTDLSKIDGVNKVERKIRQEIKFLEKVRKPLFLHCLQNFIRPFFRSKTMAKFKSAT